MLISRGAAAAAFQAFRSLSKNKGSFQQAIRNHGDIGWSYRKAPPPPEKKLYILANITQGFAWWWIFWHFWTESDHVFGEFEYPDARQWTDEELGIPEDLELIDTPTREDDD